MTHAQTGKGKQPIFRTFTYITSSHSLMLGSGNLSGILASRIAMLYTIRMIKSFRHKGLQALFVLVDYQDYH